MEVLHNALVLGGGVSGMAAALNLAEQGFDVYLVEKTDKLGGNALYIERTIQGEPIKPFVDGMVKQVEDHSKVEIFKNATFANLTGHVGHFKGTISNGDGNGKDIEFGAALIATGAVESKPKEYLFGESKAVETQHSLEERIMAGDPSLKNVKNAVFIQCVGCVYNAHTTVKTTLHNLI
jgi:heterodisulfide reductase subunit A